MGILNDFERGVSGVGDDLNKAKTVAQINECYTAMVALAVNPASQGDSLTNMLWAKFAAGVGLILGFLLKDEINPQPLITA